MPKKKGFRFPEMKPKKKVSKKYGPKPKVTRVETKPKIKRVKQEDMRSSITLRQNYLGKVEMDGAKVARHQAITVAKKRGVKDVKKLKRIGNAASDKAVDDISRAVKKQWAKSKVKETKPLWEVKRAARAKAKKKKGKKI